MTGLGEGTADFVDMVIVAGLEFEAYCATVDIGAGVDALVGYGNNVAAGRTYNAAYSRELTGLIGKVDNEGVFAAALAEATGNYTAECINVYISA